MTGVLIGVEEDTETHEGKKIAMRKGRPETFTLCRFHPGTSKHILLRKADVQECK